MTGFLIAEEGPLAGLVVRFEEGEEWSLGRDPDEVTIVLEDPMVSRRHVICRLTKEGYILENLSSVNPVTQNGKVITEPILLRDGDILQIGTTFFRFSEQEPIFGQEVEDLSLDQGLKEEEEDLSSVNVEALSEVRWLLKVVSGPNAGAEFALQRSSTYILGKDPNVCDIVFQDLSVSRQHARLSVDEDNHIFIEDLTSRNGVLINGELILDRREILSQDLVSLGTTAFLTIDREQIHETIISPPSITPLKLEEEVESSFSSLEEAAQVGAKAQDWKDMVIPTKHLIWATVFLVTIIGGTASMLALFKTEKIVLQIPDEKEEIQKALEGFEAIQYSYNPANGKIFVVGHVLTAVDKQELLYKIQNLPFVDSIEDNVVIDEYVWENMNALFTLNPDWIGISLYSKNPGKFILRGYLQTIDQSEKLSDYINLNFPYLDKLENQVIVETNLQTQIQSILLEQGFSGVTFQLSNGELVLAGRVDQKRNSSFLEITDRLKVLKGVRNIKNYVIYTSSETSRIDITAQYKVTGYSKRDDTNMFIVINGKILEVGETIDGMEITKILTNMVLLEKDGLKFRINYNLQ